MIQSVLKLGLRLAIFSTCLIAASLVNAAEIPRFDADGAAFNQHLGKGQWLIVKIWASDCGICNREAHKYVDFYEFEAGDRATVVGISLDGDDQVAAQAFIERHSVSYPNFITDYESGAKWFADITGEKFWGTPGFLIFNPAGEIKAQQIGAVPVELIVQFIDANG